MALNIKDNIFKQNDVRETVTNTEPTAVAYDTDYARYDGALAIGSASMYGMYISPNGLNLYVTDRDNSEVKQYLMSTRWGITSATHVRDLDVSAKTTAEFDVAFSITGHKMYISDITTDDVNEYDLSTNWDISTATWLQAEEMTYAADARGMYFREDGKQLLLAADPGTAYVLSYKLSTAWDISTAVYDNDNFSPGNFVNGLWFSRDGLAMILVTAAVDTYTLSTVYKPSTATLTRTFLAAPAMTERDVQFSQNGKMMYILGSASIQQYSIKQGWR